MHISGAPQTAPISKGIVYRGGQWVCQRVKGGEGDESSSIAHMLRHPSAQQCYFEMKTNKEPYFSILSSIILCVYGRIYQPYNYEVSSQIIYY